MSRQPRNRKFGNFLLQPLVQVKLGLYAIVLSLVFCVVMIYLYYSNFSEFYQLILDLTDLREEVTAIVSDKFSELVIWTVASVFVYFALTVAMSIFFTHRLVGPTYAFRRHINELKKGNYKSRVVLRKSDSFVEVAEDLNKLAETLEKQHRPTEEVG